MKKSWGFFLIALLYLHMSVIVSAETIGVVGDDVEAYTGSGTASDPYRYLFDFDSKVTWKHLSDVKTNYYTEIYEKREENEEEGRLLYSWTFSADNITNPEGPYFLGISFYNGDVVHNLAGGNEAKYFSFSGKRDLPGEAVITLYVGNQFRDDTRLELYYYGGYQSDIVHGSTPIIMENEIQEQDKLKNIAKGLPVHDEYVEFQIRYGGNYFLVEKLPEEEESSKGNEDASDEITSEQDKSDMTMMENPGIIYTDDIILGKIKEVFPTYAIAMAIADSVSKEMDEEITQADINSIIRLYIVGKEIEIIDELGKVEFERLESLILSDNQIKSIPSLQMPMLQYIDLSNNKIEDISNLIQCKNLETLLLGNNKIKKLCDISLFPALKSLNVSNNQIKKTADLDSNSLVYFNISNNKIRNINHINGLPNLEFVDISGNYIKDLPDFTVCDKLYDLYSKQKKVNIEFNHFIVIVIYVLMWLFIICEQKLNTKEVP